MPSCTAQTMVPPLSGCSAAPTGALLPRAYPNTTRNNNVSLQSHAWRGTDHGLARVQHRRMAHLLRLQVGPQVTQSIYIPSHARESRTGIKQHGTKGRELQWALSSAKIRGLLLEGARVRHGTA